MTRYALELSYDGTSYHGWQSQNNAETVQETIESSLSTLLRSTVSIVGCGRTDTGVHASHFIAHFDFEGDMVPNFLYRLNNVLPFAISVDAVYQIPGNISARFDAKSRTYRYHIHQKKDPFVLKYSYYVNRKLDVDVMQNAANILLKHEEFGAFCKSNSQNYTNICDVTRANWTETEQGLVFEIKANRFLRNMVRAIVGTLLEVGENKITIQEFENIIESQNRQRAGYSVPAKGLFLYHIEYDKTDWVLIEKR